MPGGTAGFHLFGRLTKNLKDFRNFEETYLEAWKCLCEVVEMYIS